jgi:glycosyltransferase involved in cell wall biosynthesis
MTAGGSNPVRVIHLDLEKGWRAGERQVQLLVRELAERGVAQTVVGRRGRPLLESVEGLPGVALEGVAGPLTSITPLTSIPPPAVYHAHTGNTVSLAVLSRRRGTAVVATRRLDLPVSPFWLNQADRVVAVSLDVADALRRSGVRNELIDRIPSSIDRCRTADPADRAALRGRLGIGDKTILGLTIGSLEEQNDPLTLAESMIRMPDDYRHVWVGDGSLRWEVLRLAERHGSAGRLHLSSHDPEPDRWFAAADLLVLPSPREEPEPLILDAFHFGLPVVAADVPGTSELLVEGASALLFPPGDARALADTVRRLLGDPPLAATLRAGGESVAARHDVRETASAHLRLYGELLGRPART